MTGAAEKTILQVEDVPQVVPFSDIMNVHFPLLHKISPKFVMVTNEHNM